MYLVIQQSILEYDISQGKTVLCLASLIVLLFRFAKTLVKGSVYVFSAKGQPQPNIGTRGDALIT